MRKKIVAGNWKMNQTLAEGKSLVAAIVETLPELNELQQVIIATPFLHLTQTLAQLKDKKNIHVAAQNCSSESSGAFTGEVSATMLSDAGIQVVLIGHSERREHFFETNEMIKKKIDLTLKNNITPIFCCGEPLEIRDAETQNDYVEKQISDSLFHLDAAEFSKLIIAYEPIWAIGTGRTATALQAQNMHAYIRSVIAQKYGSEIANATPILYGGSCKPSNATELFSCADVDGGLIGGASLKVDEFMGIIDAMKASK